MDLNQPLAFRVRPKSIDEFVGQEQVLGKDKLLYRTIFSIGWLKKSCADNGEYIKYTYWLILSFL